jgi:hypothetical protein
MPEALHGEGHNDVGRDVYRSRFTRHLRGADLPSYDTLVSELLDLGLGEVSSVSQYFLGVTAFGRRRLDVRLGRVRESERETWHSDLTMAGWSIRTLIFRS